VGRPRKTLTPEQVEQVGKLASVLTLEQIADFLEISDSTLRRRMNEDKTVLTAYKKGRARAGAAIGGNIIQQARDGNITAAIFYAKTQMGWRETQNIDATIRGDIVIDLVTLPANGRSED
jgi:hypothetical protein